MNTDWRNTCKTNAAALMHLLKNELRTDCRFIVGEGAAQKVFRAHRLILSLQSPVLDAMFYGEVGQNPDEIRVTDIPPTIFEKFLHAIYSETVEPASFSEACDLFCAGTKYLVQQIIDPCLAYIASHITPATALEGYELLSLYGHEEMAGTCMEVVRDKTSDILKSEGFTSIEKATLLEIIQEDKLGVASEFEIYDACCRWVREEMHRRGTAEDSQRQALMAEFIPHIRFTSMSAKEFLRCTRQNSPFTSEDSLSIVWNIVDPEAAVDLPPHLSDKKREYQPQVHLPADWKELLEVSAKRDDVDKLRHLKKAGADLSVKYYEDNRSLLHISAQSRSLEATKWLIDEGLSVHHGDDDGWTALHYAAKGGSVEVVALVLKRGADPGVRNSIGRTARDVHLPADWKELLGVAVLCGDVDKLCHLKKAGADLSVKFCKEGSTPLHIAALKRNVKTVEWLLAEGLSVHDVDANGCTALHYAADGGSMKVLELLLERGADPGVRSSSGKTARDISDRVHSNVDLPADWKKLLRAAAEIDDVKKLRSLKKAGADLSVRYYKEHWSLLHIAAFNRSVEATAWLLDEGLSVHDTDDLGYTALHFAADGGDWKVLQLLLERGADPGVTCSAGKTARDISGIVHAEKLSVIDKAISSRSAT